MSLILKAYYTRVVTGLSATTRIGCKVAFTSVGVTYDDRNQVEVELGSVHGGVVGYGVDWNTLGEVATEEDER